MKGVPRRRVARSFDRRLRRLVLTEKVCRRKRARASRRRFRSSTALREGRVRAVGRDAARRTRRGNVRNRRRERKAVRRVRRRRDKRRFVRARSSREVGAWSERNRRRNTDVGFRRANNRDFRRFVERSRFGLSRFSRSFVVKPGRRIPRRPGGLKKRIVADFRFVARGNRATVGNVPT